MNKVLKKCIEDDKAWNAACAEKEKYLEKYNIAQSDFSHDYDGFKKFLDKLKIPYVEKNLQWGLSMEIQYEGFLKVQHFHAAPNFKKYLLVDKNIDLAPVCRAYKLYNERLAEKRDAEVTEKAEQLLKTIA